MDFNLRALPVNKRRTFFLGVCLLTVASVFTRETQPGISSHDRMFKLQKCTAFKNPGCEFSSFGLLLMLQRYGVWIERCIWLGAHLTLQWNYLLISCNAETGSARRLREIR